MSWYIHTRRGAFGGHGAPAGSGIGFDKTGLVGWWDFDSDGSDAHSSGNDLTAYNSPSYASGYVDLESASTQYFESSASDFNITGGLTLVAWVRMESLADNRGVIARYDQTGNQRQYELYVDSGGRVGWACSTTGNFEAANNIETTATLSTGVDYLIAASFEPSAAFRIYIDGGESTNKTTSIPAAIYSGSAALWVGLQFNLSEVNRFDGLIYWAAVFSRTLSAAEISDLYTLGKDATYSDL